MTTRMSNSKRSPSMNKENKLTSHIVYQHANVSTAEMNGNSSGGDTSKAHSPSRRISEKLEMQNLNDRLLNYIDNVRRLESENNRLQNIVNTYMTNSTKDVAEIKKLYERELDESKNIINELAKAKSRLEIDCTKFRMEQEEALSKFSKRDKEARALEDRLKTSQSEAQEYKSRYEAMQTSLNRKQEELANLKPMYLEAEKQCAKLKKQLEDETLLRVDVENKNQTLKEDLQFKTELYNKELDRVRSSKNVELEQVDNQLRDEYDSRLVSELQRIRDETELKISEMKDDVERRYQNKLAEFQANAKRDMQFSSQMREEIANCQIKLEEQQNDLKAYKIKQNANEAKIKELEDRLKRANTKYELDITSKDNELVNLRKEIQDLLLEYQELYDIKIALDMEIGAYRKLLESEEMRLNITASHHNTHANSNENGVTHHNGSLGESFVDQSATTRKKRRIVQQPFSHEETGSAPGTPLVNSTTIKPDTKQLKSEAISNTSDDQKANKSLNNNKTKSTSRLFNFW